MSDPRRVFYESREAHAARLAGAPCADCDGYGSIDPVAYSVTWDEPGGYYCVDCHPCDGTGEVAR